MIYTDLVSHPTNDPYSHIAPYRIFSFDIECCAEEGGFPEPSKDAVITIANVITEQVRVIDTGSFVGFKGTSLQVCIYHEKLFLYSWCCCLFL